MKYDATAFRGGGQERHPGGTCALVMFSLSFWIWLAKDFVAPLLGKYDLVGGNYLLTITFLVLATVVLGRWLARTPPDSKPLVAGRGFLQWFVVSVLVIGLSILTFGPTAFSVFKLTNYVLNVALALVVAYHLVSYRVHTTQWFTITGMAVALAGYAVIGDPRLASEEIGLRSLHVAHLNVQDFYVVLWLSCFSALCLAPANVARLVLFALASIISVPIIILMNSRMIPLTVGVSIIAAIVGSRRVAATSRGPLHALMAVTAVVVLTWGMNHYLSANPYSRMASTYSDGIMNSFYDDPRYYSFREAIDNFSENPLFGVGFGRFALPGVGLNTDDRVAGCWAHNVFLELGSEMGIIGVIVFGVPLLSCLSRILKRIGQGNMDSILCPAACFIYALATMQLTQVLWYALIWMGLVWVGMAIDVEQGRAWVNYQINGCSIRKGTITARTRRAGLGQHSHVHMEPQR